MFEIIYKKINLLVLSNFQKIFFSRPFFEGDIFCRGSIIMSITVAYWFIYIEANYEQIKTDPDLHERLSFRFAKFSTNKFKNMLFSAYFIIHRFLFLFILIKMNSTPVLQSVWIWFINVQIFMFKFNTFKNMLNKLLYIFDRIILIALSLLLNQKLECVTCVIGFQYCEY